MADNAVINIDDAAGEYMLSVSKGKVLTTAIDNEKADLRAENIKHNCRRRKLYAGLRRQAVSR